MTLSVLQRGRVMLALGQAALQVLWTCCACMCLCVADLLTSLRSSRVAVRTQFGGVEAARDGLNSAWEAFSSLQDDKHAHEKLDCLLSLALTLRQDPDQRSMFRARAVDLLQRVRAWSAYSGNSAANSADGERETGGFHCPQCVVCCRRACPWPLAHTLAGCGRC